ncbi:MAG: AmmeMemoRadiSam system radical SAM enzyme [Nitrospirota bacterium]|nr:AmmeMemoRadiSam system radical SAM enzyme [Nitrospirota bacterium]MDH5769153.1 AmmeMemoRadiSam system radical SAM enzyme [Nitrospirota bacterium]
MKEAMFYEKRDEKEVQCFLCAHHCIIKEGKRGICFVRENREGTLYSLVYGKVISFNIDPIEKKPLFHFLPGSTSISIATVGCNFHCLHCQNFEIAQYPKEHGGDIPGQIVSPEDIVKAAEQNGCKSISYTYTEPTIFFEFAYDCARLAHEKGIKNVFVSNGYTGPEATRAIAPYLDGNNIDLKGNADHYKKMCGGRLEPVQETIKLMKELGVWVEVTTLIIPDHNDSEEDLRNIAEFINSVDPFMPWHVSQFYPTYKLTDKPRTPVKTLRRAREIGFEAGLNHVYEGNVPGEGGENTYCPSCKELLIKRFGFSIIENRIKDGRCSKCATEIKGVWK